jgi:hypothetical protein
MSRKSNTKAEEMVFQRTYIPTQNSSEKEEIWGGLRWYLENGGNTAEGHYFLYLENAC